MTIASLWPVKMDALAAKGNWRGIRRIQFLGGPAIVLVLRALPVFLIALYGSEFIQTMINSIPTWAMNGLAAVGKMLPALGMSMLMKFMYKKSAAAFLRAGLRYRGLLRYDRSAAVCTGWCMSGSYPD